MESPRQRVPVAIKRLICDISGVPKDVLEEFLFEIKLIRFVSN
jgi:hypothetical protein